MWCVHMGMSGVNVGACAHLHLCSSHHHALQRQSVGNAGQQHQMDGIKGEVGVGVVRDEVGDVRDDVGDVRDDVGDVRDDVGDVRDDVGDVRDEVGG